MKVFTFASLMTMMLLTLASRGWVEELKEIQQKGVLRHLGIPYANFITGSGEGMEVDLVKKFAERIGVRYEFVASDWGTIIPDLLGHKVKAKGKDVDILEAVPVRGDIIANGFTILPWREKVVNYSIPTFPSQIWLIARAESNIRPIKPTGNIEKDIKLTRALMKDRGVLSMEKTCLDPSLYDLQETGARIICYKGNLNELAPAVMNNVAEMTILDVPDALVALSKWPGKIKIIGPISDKQQMAAGFTKTSPELLKAYNNFLLSIMKDGTYMEIVRKYYPTAPLYFPQFFKDK